MLLVFETSFSTIAVLKNNNLLPGMKEGVLKVGLQYYQTYFILLCYFIVGGPGVKKAVATKRHQETEPAGPESKRLTTSHDNVKTPVR